MKTKKFQRKLSLKKTTVAHLSQEKMSKMRGGALTILDTNCDTCDIYTPEPWCPPDITEGPETACILCPQTINCDPSLNGCDTEWLGQSCQTCLTYVMVSECGC